MPMVPWYIYAGLLELPVITTVHFSFRTFDLSIIIRYFCLFRTINLKDILNEQRRTVENVYGGGEKR